MLLAPILAVTLALLLAGTINSMLPSEQELHYKDVPTPTVNPLSPTPAPQMAAASLTGFSMPWFIIATALVIVSIVVVLLFFRDKDLEKAISE